MKKRLVGIVFLGVIVVYGAGCLLPANLLLQLAGDVLDGSDNAEGDDIGDDMDTNGESDAAEQ